MIAHPSFVAQVQGEVYKWRRHRLYQSLLAMPLILVATITLALIIFGRRSSSPVEDTAVISSIGNVDFGSRSGFTMASALLFAFFGNFYWLGFMVAYVWAVANEFNWKTIKMIATRQPSRPVIVLSKIAFAGLFTVAMYGTFIAAWFILAMFFRWYYPARDPLFNPTDFDAFVKGLSYFAKFCLSVWIWGCLGIAVGVIGKSIVGGVLVTVLVNGLDLESLL
jgi:ABC-type transport system involved in multi-copper enzyme maturation permease subunit